MNVNIKPKNYTDSRKYSVAEFNTILSFLNGLPSIVELNGKASKEYVDMLALAQYTGFAEASTVPAATDHVVKYDATAGVTYPNFKNSNGQAITIPIEVNGKSVVRASLIGMGNVWQYEVGFMSLSGYLQDSQKGSADGLATLGSDSKVPIEQVPDMSAQYVPSNQKGSAGGVPTLDVNAKIPADQYNTEVLATKTDISLLAPIAGSPNSLESAFVDSKTIPLGALSNGRMTSISGEDTNASYKKTDFIAVQPSWIFSFNRSDDVNSRNIWYDEFKNPLIQFSWTINTDVIPPPRARFMRISDLNVPMNAMVITVKSSIGITLASKIDETEDKKANEQSALDNYFDPSDHIPSASLTAGVITSNSGGLRTTPFMKLKEAHSGWLVVAPIYNAINPWRIAFYRADGTYIGLSSIPAGGNVVPLFGPQWRYGQVEVLPESVYFRLLWDHRAENTEAQIQSVKIIDREAWRIFLSNAFFWGEINAARVRDIIISNEVINRAFADKIMYKQGDSITANNSGAGSHNIWVNGALNPALVNTRASGGATLTTSVAAFGADYIGTGNHFMNYCETFVRDISNGTIPMPDIYIIMGGTNDFDNSPRAYVTPEELAAANMPYDEYMESTFMTVGANQIGYNVLKPLTDVPRSKAAGAIRYIIERVGAVSPKTVFFVCTPIQSTLHNQLRAARVVRDIKWMANRLSVPIIDQWNSANMPMLWDYGTDRNFLADRIHPFNDATQTRGSAIMGRFIVNELLRLYIPYLA